MNDYEAHLSSYDHAHKQRMKDMKAMVRDPNAGARARKAEAKADGLVSIKMPDGSSAAAAAAGAAAGAGAGGGFKKGGFKKSGFKSTMTPAEGVQTQAQVQVQPAPTGMPDVVAAAKPPLSTLDESDTEDEGYEVYDPRYPTD